MPCRKLLASATAVVLLVASASPAAHAQSSAVARKFAVTPANFTTASEPAVTVRVNKKGARTLRAKLVFKPVRGHGQRTTVNLGTIAANRTGVVPLRTAKLKPGRYSVRIGVATTRNVRITRTRRSPGEATVVVKAAPVAVATSVGPVTGGVFPVAGPHTLGGPNARFGTGRTGHLHEGQDVVAPAGTPVVAPVPGTIQSTSYQAGAAGYYVVLNGIDGRAFFMAHLLKDSTTVLPGQPVTAGQPIAQVGATGNASGPHLHFEIWINGWRASSASAPVDPLAQLLAWGG